MLNGAGGCARHEFPPPCSGWRLGALVVLVAASVAAWSTGGAAAQDGLQWTPVVWDAGAIYRGATIASDLVLPVAAESIDQFVAPRMLRASRR